MPVGLRTSFTGRRGVVQFTGCRVFNLNGFRWKMQFSGSAFFVETRCIRAFTPDVYFILVLASDDSVGPCDGSVICPHLMRWCRWVCCWLLFVRGEGWSGLDCVHPVASQRLWLGIAVRASWADGSGAAAGSRRHGRGRGGRTRTAASMVLTCIADSTVDSVEAFDSWSRFHWLFVSGLTVVALGCLCCRIGGTRVIVVKGPIVRILSFHILQNKN